MGGCGTIFTLTGSGNSEKILYAFTGPPDGVLPGFGSLISDERGALYGTTGFGGSANFGIVYKLTPSGSGYGETILHSFQGGTDGELPAAGVVADARGNLYGTTDGDGSATFGTVFELKRSASSYVEKVLHNFQNDGTDGEIPSGTLTLRDGTLYGTTVAGGTHGDGTVFMLATMGSAHKETVLYSFGSNPNDGQQPFTAVTFVHGHDLYTTTSEGGAHGLGAVAKLAGSGRSYRESVLYSFGGPDGADPQAPLLFRHGSLYGTTYVGGAYNGGTAFRVSLNGTERVLHSFGATGDGFNPDAGLIVDSQGRFLSTTQFGPSYGCSGQGYYGCGTVFRVP
jgi:uncharacterized repeat protein (TIGR03803 family)